MVEHAPPLVTIGVPVYNGERFLGAALESLLAQTLEDHEIIVADNASTDGTRTICEEFAQRDRRVRIVRHAVNIGAPANWNSLVPLARGRFFKWASANDTCAPQMLERCVQALHANPAAVLCYGRTQLVDAEHQPIEVYRYDVEALSASPAERFAMVSTQLRLNNAQCGLIRIDALRRTRLDRLYPSGDMALMAELALYGRILLVPEILTFRVQSKGTFTSMLSPMERQLMYDPKAKAPMKVLLGRRHADQVFSIARAPIPFAEKLRAWRAVSRQLLWDRDKLWDEFRSVLRRQG